MRLQHARRAPWHLLSVAAAWPVTSQHQARRNALVATTALTARRAERLEVDDFLARLAAERDARARTA